MERPLGRLLFTVAHLEENQVTNQAEKPCPIGRCDGVHHWLVGGVFDCPKFAAPAPKPAEPPIDFKEPESHAKSVIGWFEPPVLRPSPSTKELNRARAYLALKAERDALSAQVKERDEMIASLKADAAYLFDAKTEFHTCIFTGDEREMRRIYRAIGPEIDAARARRKESEARRA